MDWIRNIREKGELKDIAGSHHYWMAEEVLFCFVFVFVFVSHRFSESCKIVR